MQFSPGFDEPLLALRKAARQQADSINRKHSRVILIIGMKVREVVALGRLDEHANNYTIKSAKFRHFTSIYLRGHRGSSSVTFPTPAPPTLNIETPPGTLWKVESPDTLGPAVWQP